MTKRAIILRAAVLALSVAAATACGSDSTAPAATNAACAISLSGGVTSDLVCSDLAAVWTSNNNKSAVGFEGKSGPDTLSVSVGFDGEPAVRTYVSGTDAMPVVLLTNGSAIWIADNADGDLTLVLTSVRTTSSGAGLKGYEVHGSLTATMRAEVSNNSVSPVTVKATF